jgi:hypothetical protein
MRGVRCDLSPSTGELQDGWVCPPAKGEYGIAPPDEEFDTRLRSRVSEHEFQRLDGKRI